MSIQVSPTILRLITAVTLASAWAAPIKARAHSVTAKLDGAEPITETLIPALGDIDFLETGVFMTYPSPTPGPDKPGWDCTPIYGPREDTRPEVPDELQDHIKDREPPLEYGELPESDAVIVGYDCVATFTEPILWNPRKHCRDWFAVYQVEGRIPIDSNSFDVTFGDNGRVNSEFNLDDADFTVTLVLVGDRVDNIGCTAVHLSSKRIIYAAAVHVGGVSGSVDVTLAAAPPDATGATNSTIYIESIDPDSIEFAIERDSVTIDTVTNNRIDELLLAGSAVLAPLPGVPLIFGVGTLAWLTNTDMADVLLDFSTALYGFASGDCGNTEDCLVDIVQGLLNQRIDLDMNFALFEVHGGINTGNVVDAGEVLSDITSRINQAIAFPLAWSTNLTIGGMGLQVDAGLTNLETSLAKNSLTVTWDVSVTNLVAGSCNTGLTGYVAPAAGTANSVSGDVDITVPFSLVGELGAAVLRQVNFCTNYTFGGLAGSLAPNGPLTVSRGGSQRIDLSLPALLTPTAQGTTGWATFDINMQTTPGVDTRGDIQLELTTLFITNLTGSIRSVRFPGVPATYNFGPGGATLTTRMGTVPATNIAPGVEAAANGAIGRFFPIPLSLRTNVYVAPHVYLQADNIVVRDGSFSVGIDIMDGSTPVDVSVARLEAAGPYRDFDSPFGRYREVPLWAIIKNRDDWNVAPPVDVTIEIGLSQQVIWLPPLQPREEFAVPFTAYVGIDSSGTILLAPTVVVTADILGQNPVFDLLGLSTIYDPDRSNNEHRVILDNGWFQPDYKVELGSLSAIFGLQPFGSLITNYTVVSGDFTVTTRVRNIGGEAGAANSLRRLNVFVNETQYASDLVGALDPGEEVEVVLQFHVPEGPSAMLCTYKFKSELVAGDKKAGNDRDYLTIEVESGGCVGGGPTDADLIWIQEHGLEALESKWDGLNQVTWGTDNRGHDLGAGSNAPILDHIPPP
jgi:hypothetical protein